MPDPVEPADLTRARTRSLADRDSKVTIDAFARPVERGASLEQFLDGLGDLLAVRDLRGLAAAVAAARLDRRPVIWALGGHVVKTGLAPVLIRMMERDAITALVLNGAAAIHDWEIAAAGATSEEVPQALDDGCFGLTEETGAEFAAAARQAHETERGFGDVLGKRILDAGLPHADRSLLAAASRLSIPVTVHVSVGSDVVHQHPEANGAAIGAATFTDFRRLVTLAGQLSCGVWINCGSAVQLPEVFLKALALAGNLGSQVTELTTANLDMFPTYRTEENVLRRPTRNGGRWFRLIGHHEINVPLLAAAIEIESDRLQRS